MCKLSCLTILFLVINLYAQSPHGKKLNIDCLTCHNINSWKIDNKTSFDHSTTNFQLIGQHEEINCRDCHRTLIFEEVKSKTNCSSCHNDIHSNTVGSNCERCHTPKTWIVENSSELHRKSRFPLLGNHLNADCSQCHKSFSTLKFETLSVICFDCHSQDYYSTESPNHQKANFSKECQECHKSNSSTWSTTSILHDFFPLTGAHDIANCFACHKQTDYKGLSKDCQNCHLEHYNNTKSPSHVKYNFSKNCNDCHSTDHTGWSPAKFDQHDQIYPLIGAHNLIRNDCNKCHSNGFNQSSSRTCFSCHETNYNSVNNPNHKISGFSKDCIECHSQNKWKPSTFDHDGKYFPVYSGEHKGKWNNCSDCHVNQSNYNTFECINCHEHEKTKMDNEHRGVNGYAYQSMACFTCHPRGDKNGSVNHSLTNFPLLGAHTNVSCNQCHATGYKGTSTLCYTCHQTKYETAPNHKSQNYPTTCEQCHNSTDWKNVSFNHSQTNFPLLGAHTNVSCNQCHTTGYKGTSTLCYTCHQTKYETAPNHKSQNYSTTCEQCHNSTDWKNVSFNHSQTNFPLLGAHTNVSCNQCHATGYKGTSTLCYTCHQTKYETAPNHKSQNYPTTCEQCHNSTDWKNVSFNHSQTNFPLLGAHTNVSCNQCHTTGYKGTSTLCYTCHQTKYKTAPNHKSQNYPTTCEQCHNSTDWKNVSFNHSQTNFPLLGAHTNVSCNQCHTTGFKGTSTLCYTCHQTKYVQSVNPNHKNLNLPTTCEQCHTTNPGWKPAVFPIHNNFYPILGAHLNIANQCANCHAGNYNTKHNGCVSCHLTNYNNTTNPDHSLSQFPTNCEECHSQNAWKPSTFNHDGKYFPIYSGEHNGKWSLCSDCHNVQTNYNLFECINCHEHNKTEMDKEHSSVSGYIYASNSCYQCHPTGKKK